MSLHGTLETFALPDVMALLAATRKTGELRVVGGKLDGRVHLDAGRVVSANVGRADSFVDAVFELLRLSSGKFSFDADKAPESPGEPVDVEPLLLEAQDRLAEWRGIEAVVPSLDHGVELVKDLGDPHVTLAAEQWKMVVAVAGSRCVSEVADRLGLGEYGVCKALKELVESGVALVADPPAPAPKAKAEPKPEPKAEAKPAPEPEPEAAEPEPAAKDEAPATADKVEKAHKAEKEQASAGDKPAVEPELKPKPLPEAPVPVPALTKTDTTSPAAPGQEPEPQKAPAPAAKKVAATTSASGNGNGAGKGVDPAQAKQLVSQLAAMSGDKPAAPAKPAQDKADKPDAAAAKASDAEEEAPATADAAAGEGGDSEEPLNRGLLLKFLSSVRQ